MQNDEYVLKFKPDAKMLYTTAERVEIIESIRIVDKVITYNVISPETLENIDFDILALGEDHVGERFRAVEEWCEKNNKKIVRLKRTQGICSSDIKNKLL